MPNLETSRRILVINDALEEGLLYLAFLVEIFEEKPNNITVAYSENEGLQMLAAASQENKPFTHILCDDLFGQWIVVAATLEELYRNNSTQKPHFAITSDDGDRKESVEEKGLFFIHKMAKYKITDALNLFLSGETKNTLS